MAQSIVNLSKSGIQVFIATHSLFLLRELEILMSDLSPDKQDHQLDARFFGLHLKGDYVAVKQGNAIDEIGDITTLDEELAQSERFMMSGV